MIMAKRFEGKQFPRNVGALLAINVASYPRRTEIFSYHGEKTSKLARSLSWHPVISKTGIDVLEEPVSSIVNYSVWYMIIECSCDYLATSCSIPREKTIPYISTDITAALWSKFC
jgi:hypothetical protein